MPLRDRERGPAARAGGAIQDAVTAARSLRQRPAGRRHRGIRAGGGWTPVVQGIRTHRRGCARAGADAGRRERAPRRPAGRHIRLRRAEPGDPAQRADGPASRQGIFAGREDRGPAAAPRPGGGAQLRSLHLGAATRFEFDGHLSGRFGDARRALLLRIRYVFAVGHRRFEHRHERQRAPARHGLDLFRSALAGDLPRRRHDLLGPAVDAAGAHGRRAGPAQLRDPPRSRDAAAADHLWVGRGAFDARRLREQREVVLAERRGRPVPRDEPAAHRRWRVPRRAARCGRTRDRADGAVLHDAAAASPGPLRLLGGSRRAAQLLRHAVGRLQSEADRQRQPAPRPLRLADGRDAHRGCGQSRQCRHRNIDGALRPRRGEYRARRQPVPVRHRPAGLRFGRDAHPGHFVRHDGPAYVRPLRRSGERHGGAFAARKRPVGRGGGRPRHVRLPDDGAASAGVGARLCGRAAAVRPIDARPGIHAPRQCRTPHARRSSA